METIKIVKKDSGEEIKIKDIKFSKEEKEEFTEHFNDSTKNKEAGVKIKSRKNRG